MPNDAPLTLPPFANKLIQSGYITLPQLQQVLIEKRKSNRPLLDLLQAVTGRPLPPELVRQHRQDHLFNLKILHGVEIIDPETDTIDWEKIETLFKTLIPFDICRRYQIIPLSYQNSPVQSLVLAMVNPGKKESLDDLKRILRMKDLQFDRRVISLQDYNGLMEKYRIRKLGVATQTRALGEQELETLVDVTDIFEDNHGPALRRDEPDEDLNLINQSNQGPVITLVNNILVAAIENRASEIHIEPQETQLLVKFRQDGKICPGFNPISKEISGAVISRLKLGAELDITQRLKPQKGKMQRTFSGRRVDFWVHTLPTNHGEKLLIKVVDYKSDIDTLEKLILIPETRKQIEQMLERKAGLLLLTAPTGSGVSTTFYSLLTHRNQDGVNISTLEDPIERTIDGITQVEINPRQGMNYESMIDSFLNQDVDIIGIDRLEEATTVTAAVDAALKGHLIISSLPINDVSAALVRLNKSGVESSTIAQALIGLINQRLLRRVCPTCRLKHQPGPEEIKVYRLSAEKLKQHTIYRANTLNNNEIEQARERGRLCRQCNGVGYYGQVGVYEVLRITPRLQGMIGHDLDTAMMKRMAIADGFKSLLNYALELVTRGDTTFEEIERIIGDTNEEATAEIAPELMPPQIIKRVQSLETLIASAMKELQSLKQDLGLLEEPSISQEIPEIPLEEPEERAASATMVDFSYDKETIVSDHRNPIYEELTDPGEWNELKEELDMSKETVVSESFEDGSSGWEVNSSFRSLPDPWS
ncbi:MAG: hypothetical protein N5P05_002560 [Chroococcopsis gigantea SAG 12.99]|jgi:type IV pilus assembly protein PilB|nr:type II/IV secretion system protein [Chlorogloea purpurea SAG 13.99]MDV3000954.1 hypothetical protein [Chroococcopsis gigantea SAG 12.99]